MGDRQSSARVNGVLDRRRGDAGRQRAHRRRWEQPRSAGSRRRGSSRRWPANGTAGLHRRRRWPRDVGDDQTGPTAVASTGDGGFLSRTPTIRRAARHPGGDDHHGGGHRRRCPRPAACSRPAATGARRRARRSASRPTSLATPDGGYLISDIGVHVVRKVDADGTISRGRRAPTEARAASAATAGRPPAPSSTTRIGRRSHPRRRLSHRRLSQPPHPQGLRRTASSTPSPGADHAAGPAAHAATAAPPPRRSSTLPQGVASRPDGSYFIGDSADNRVRRVDANGTITNAAGDATGDTSLAPTGDGGARPSARSDTARTSRSAATR